jgi:actin-like ATPase involved in cell morphogenesis
MAYALGIDLGTTFTAAAVARNGRVDIVGMGNHTSAIPSAVLLRDDGTLLVGDAATRRGQQEPTRLAKEFKRRLGDATPIILGHTPYSAERLMAAVIRHVIDTVTERQGGPPSAVVIAHPANWGPYKRELLEGAATLSGAAAAAFVTEPEAAAVHFAAGERVDEGGVVAVYDLGGGTFDAAVLRREGDRFVTMGQPQGIERLGGIDFDEAVLSHVRATLGDAITNLDGSDPVVRSGMVRLRDDCISAKEALSDDSEAVIPVMLPGVQTQVRITRPEFEAMIRPVLRETVAMLQRALELASVTPTGLSAVVLAGGSSRIPLVAEMVGAALGRPVSVDAHPKDTVALGAARLAASTERGTTREAAAAGPAAVATSPVQSAPTAPTPPAGPTVAAPPPQPAVAAAPAAAATAQGATAPPRRTAPQQLAASPAGAQPKRSRKGALIAGSAIVAAAVGVGAFVLLGGDDGGDAAPDVTGQVVQTIGQPIDDGDSNEAIPPATAPSATTAEPSGRDCTAQTGRCVFITDIGRDGDNMVVQYETVGYQPHQNAGPDSRHVHFYFDTVPPTQAGVPADPSNWVAWGLEEGGGELVYTFPVADIPEEASQLCASVAKVDHALDDLNFQCVRLPSD